MSKFNDFVIRGILKKNEHNISIVKNIKTFVSIDFDREQYKEIRRCIKRGDMEQLHNLVVSDNEFEFLDVMSFNDQIDRKFIVTVYTNNALENDPQVIDIFLLL